jgi:hypothetical protein
MHRPAHRVDRMSRMPVGTAFESGFWVAAMTITA